MSDVWALYGSQMRGTPAEEEPPPTDEELEAIWDQFDDVLTPRNSKKLHLASGGEIPICYNRWNGFNVTTSFNAHPIEAYPPGYKPVCGYCLQVWRAWAAEQ